MYTIDSSSVDGVAERSGATLPLLLQQQPHDTTINRMTHHITVVGNTRSVDSIDLISRLIMYLDIYAGGPAVIDGGSSF